MNPYSSLCSRICAVLNWPPPVFAVLPPASAVAFIRQHHKWVGLFPFSDMNIGRIWNSSFWETIYDFYFIQFLDYKKMRGWIFTITGWLFSHTEATQLYSTWFLHNRSPLKELKKYVLKNVFAHIAKVNGVRNNTRPLWLLLLHRQKTK